MSATFDEAGALERVGGDRELLRELTLLCREQCDERLMLLDHEVRHKNLQAVGEIAHFLKGGLGNVGAEAAFEAAHSLELAAKGGDVEAIGCLTQALIEAISEFFRVVG